MSSAYEAETGALYYGCKHDIPYRVTLQEMVHPQTEPTPVTTNNNTAHGLTLGTMKSKASKSNDMRFQWLKFREAQRLFACIPLGAWSQETSRLPKQAPPRHPPSTYPPTVCDRQGSTPEMNRIPPQFICIYNQVTFYNQDV